MDPTWPVVDAQESHGTEMAGLALFGDQLPELLSGNQRVQLSHRLESVRMLHNQQPHSEETWGYVTQASLAKAEIQTAQRNRVACLAVTAEDYGRDHGRPSSWSAAIDQHSSGQLDDFRRLYVVSAGNIRDIHSNQDYRYPDAPLASSIEDPAQSWNALTVGAFTNQTQIRSAHFDGYQPVARRGGICPTSRTSYSWGDQAWPFKPDITMEGGNYVQSPAGNIDGCEDLALLTTKLDATGRLLTCSGDTSAATAQAARYAAILMADYPHLWPETVRGLLVHSAEWTQEMQRQLPGTRETDRHNRIRCFGYGVPNLDRARYTVENCVSLIHQGTIQPYKLDGTEAKTNHFTLHSLPWPKAALEQMHDHDVTVKVTLSYFIEPSPAGRGWGRKFRYASHGLRFALRGPTETESQFRQRISKQEWEEEQEGRPSTSDPINWAVGVRLRTKGSIHCDWWTPQGGAAELARCGQVAVFPVTGWWRERKHLGVVERQTRYSLII
ncbi:MAG TPA: S8 family peptidase, partial [bacterium]|nr:S8 family peptidase [bacterium]